MNPKQIIIALFFFVVVLLSAAYYLKNNPFNVTGKTSPTTTVTDVSVPKVPTKLTNASMYVAQNIATLSQIKVAEGEKISVTKVQVSTATGTVEFVNGGKSYTADFAYTTDPDGTITVTSFTFRK